MQGYVELSLEDLPAGSEVRENLEQVLSCGNRAAKLIRQVLTFSRQDQESGEQEKEPVVIGSTVKEVLKMMRSSLPATIKICRRIEADSSVVMADPTQIHQVLVNLCTNASHAMGEAGGLLEVSVGDVNLESARQIGDESLGPGCYVKVSVRDTGCGIAETDREKIFEKFRQADGSITRQSTGTGLGLTISRELAAMLAGSIGLESEPGKGSTFWLDIPFTLAKEQL